ncbi:MAG: hypothetical protein KDA80_02825 [Planctomycetaceae bacterium]|nr:hypothetical protein [Planctomycetaceae bacterium]
MQTQTSTSRCFRLVPLLLLVFLFGCGYGEVNGHTYECAKAIYSICNRQDSERLAQIAQLVETLRAKEKLSRREAGWLTDIIRDAEQGNWETAARESRQLMVDQIQTSR